MSPPVTRKARPQFPNSEVFLSPLSACCCCCGIDWPCALSFCLCRSPLLLLLIIIVSECHDVLLLSISVCLHLPVSPVCLLVSLCANAAVAPCSPRPACICLPMLSPHVYVSWSLLSACLLFCLQSVSCVSWCLLSPIGSDGFVELPSGRRICIARVQLEEDTATMMHRHVRRHRKRQETEEIIPLV